MTTPHINAKKEDFAETVLFPGDPLRAKFIAENFLQNSKEITNVRNMLGFTGSYQGERISVMGSGMGIPSCSIYAKELIGQYNVKNLIRVGTAGGLNGTKVKDIIIAGGASTDSAVNRSRLLGFDFAATASFHLMKNAYETALRKGIPVKVGTCFSSDLFYHPLDALVDRMEAMGILCVEMEAAGLYGVAAEYKANALSILTISDHIRTRETMSAEERQLGLQTMIELAIGSIFTK